MQVPFADMINHQSGGGWFSQTEDSIRLIAGTVDGLRAEAGLCFLGFMAFKFMANEGRGIGM